MLNSNKQKKKRKRNFIPIISPHHRVFPGSQLKIFNYINENIEWKGVFTTMDLFDILENNGK